MQRGERLAVPGREALEGRAERRATGMRRGRARPPLLPPASRPRRSRGAACPHVRGGGTRCGEEPLLHDLPLDLQAKILSLTEPPAFAALRRCDCRHREAADAAVAHMLAQLRAAVAAYASADHCRVLRHCRLTSWPITSCAIALAGGAPPRALASSRALLCDCLQRLKRIAALHAGKGSTLAALRHLHARSVLRFETWQQSVVPLGLECECSIGALGGSQHLDSVCAGEPSPLGPAAQRLLADALFTSAFGMHHRASSDADAERAVPATGSAATCCGTRSPSKRSSWRWAASRS